MNRIEEINQTDAFEAIAQWAGQFDYFAFYVNSKQDFIAGIDSHSVLTLRETKGAFDKISAFQQKAEVRIAGYLGYDLKNDLEDLQSSNPDVLQSPEAVFFEPKIWLNYKAGELEISGGSTEMIDGLLNHIEAYSAVLVVPNAIEMRASTSRELYLEKANFLKSKLQRGDIYEANYCIQFEGKPTDFQPLPFFSKLQSRTEAPFSVYAKLDTFYIMSASPERFLKMEDGKLISQPIKGTAPRSTDEMEDQKLAKALRQDQKELSENVMIVDLVRNDLSHVAKRGTVSVDELFGVQSFRTVHHLVSTISAQLNHEKFNHWDAIKACYPMGSMTGAPKISAMNLIEETENFKRSAYAGSFGWVDPNGDFDFNVLIRTLCYQANTHQLAVSVGSAITIGSDPAKEYDECILKAKVLMDLLNEAKQHETA